MKHDQKRRPGWQQKSVEKNKKKLIVRLCGFFKKLQSIFVENVYFVFEKRPIESLPNFST